MEELVERYVRLRDAKSKLANGFKAKVATLDDAMAKIEALLLQEFKEQGMESVRTQHGTAYKSTRTSATVADWESVLAYVKQHDLWNLIDRRVSKTAVEQFKEEHADLPPGINWREEVVVNIRRS